MIKPDSGARRKAVRASECLPSRTNTGARRKSVAKLVLISLLVTTILLIHDQLHIFTHTQETCNMMHELDHNYQVACVCVHIYMYTERLVDRDGPSRRVEAGCENTVLPLSWYALESRLSSNEEDVHASLFQTSSL